MLGYLVRKPQVVTRTETREVIRNVEAKAVATAQVRIVEVAGPVVTRWRTAPAAPGCPAVNEVVQERGPTELVMQKESHVATTQATKETSRQETTTAVQRAVPSDWHLAIQGRPSLSAVPALPGRWWVGEIVERRVVGPFSFGVVGIYGSGSGLEAGLSLGVSW